ncbi:aldehyde dehydrogenase [Nocardioides sp. Root1257]|uniref:aldehyde dehydrogenase n=1 Tax=unclassified Nocardioides TaxID=2615069 RepID=UPI0006F7F13C|nr:MULTISPECIES: aldehyde dehydrogenase [unclassified Nocardioides]KQW42648.1 aldehyde dehydrogenase [Nocardioides sp. Root1257]KRC39906.1 aldehyde dehydrogenase [Nocardioides sp. Root224]
MWTGQFNRLYVGGQWIRSSGTDTIAVVSPTSEEVIARVPAAAPEDVDAAVAAAREAFDRGPWPRATVDERIAVMTNFADRLESGSEEIANLLTDEMGSPIAQSRGAQVGAAISIARSYLDIVTTYPFEQVRRATSGSALVLRKPVGVVAAVVPWNVPLGVTFHKLFPALLSGCTAIIKPSPEAPLFAYWLAEQLAAAGVPDGVVNVVPAEREVSEYLVTHPGVDKVAFTGSTAAGRRIASLCGQDLRKFTLELGGKSAALVLDDADLDATVEALRFGSFRNSGQVCTLKTRVLVSRNREQELLDRLLALVDSMPVGDPHHPDTQIGPMVSERHRGTVEGYIGVGRDEGARLVTGGGRPADLERGWFVQPTIFSSVSPEMRIAQEEIFGPVLSVLTYTSEDEAVTIANDSRYGLSGAVFTSDLDHGLSIARRIYSGAVDLNGAFGGWGAPFGGVKDSGIGRESGPEGFESYVNVMSIGVPADYASTL